MSDHPTTFQGESADTQGLDWNDHAAIHHDGDGQGVLDGMKALHRGTLAEMVRHIRALPSEERSGLVIQKAGDRKYCAAEIEALALREDYPG